MPIGDLAEQIDLARELSWRERREAEKVVALL
jgi:hypothetical protein